MAAAHQPIPIALLPGDGIGPEIIVESRKVLEAVGTRFDHDFSFSEHLIGGCAIESTGNPLPPETVAAAKASDVVLLGAVGGPQWSDPQAKIRPEQGLLGIREELGLFANIRPVRVHRQLAAASPLKPEIIEGVDILFFRELTGGIYFGGSTTSTDGRTVTDHMRYSVEEIERIVRLAAQAAQQRSGKLTSVDKANVLAVSRLWRSTTDRVMAHEFPDVEYETILVDAMAMHLLSRPSEFDVVVTGNLFGDILTDEASMLPGSMGLLPSASVGLTKPGVFEPIHGSAPDIAGKGKANPLAAILTAAMGLRYSLDMESEATAIESAVDAVLDEGLRTPDIAAGTDAIDTASMGSAVVDAVRRYAH
ncbi:MAG: 3-isopropylmalate dehydrogenase [Actinomycetia bacterium]|nr:3-isopropylmalate dehydrogenase [Actinomycetes bacterium]